VGGLFTDLTIQVIKGFEECKFKTKSGGELQSGGSHGFSVRGASWIYQHGGVKRVALLLLRLLET
jgi:hypothetical protein